MNKHYFAAPVLALLLSACVGELNDQARRTNNGDIAGYSPSEQRVLDAYRLKVHNREEHDAGLLEIGFTGSSSVGYVIYQDANGLIFNTASNGSERSPEALIPRANHAFAGGSGENMIVAYSNGGRALAWHGARPDRQIILSDDIDTFGRNSIHELKPVENANSVIGTTANGDVRYWSLTSGNVIARYNLGTNEARAVDPGHRTGDFFYGDTQGRVFQYRPSGTRQLYAHNGPVMDVQYLHKADVMISVAKDGTAIAYDDRAGRIIGRENIRLAGYKIYPSPSEKFAVVAPSIGDIIIVDTQRKSLRRVSFTGAARNILNFVYEPRERFGFALHAGEDVKMWELATGIFFKRLKPETGGIATHIALSPTHQLLIIASSNGNIEYWNANTGLYVGLAAELGQELAGMTINAPGTRLAVVLADDQVMSFDVKSQIDNVLELR